ncbi:MAG: L-threonylcarbamoyladenylate synthase, partial [Rickettsiales bacterium]|nr:L-threonylcarbamoyladenylate synthase [Rickettsiales bacterium]
MQGLNEFLAAGGVIAFPTDTVWGLGVLPTPAGCDALYEIKRRPREKHFIIMSDSVEHLPPLSPRAAGLAARFWPGALTIIDGGVGYRIPESRAIRDLCAAVDGHCLATTSANISGMPPLTSADE